MPSWRTSTPTRPACGSCAAGPGSRPPSRLSPTTNQKRRDHTGLVLLINVGARGLIRRGGTDVALWPRWDLEHRRRRPAEDLIALGHGQMPELLPREAQGVAVALADGNRREVAAPHHAA